MPRMARHFWVRHACDLAAGPQGGTASRVDRMGLPLRAAGHPWHGDGHGGSGLDPCRVGLGAWVLPGVSRRSIPGSLLRARWGQEAGDAESSGRQEVGWLSEPAPLPALLGTRQRHARSASRRGRQEAGERWKESGSESRPGLATCSLTAFGLSGGQCDTVWPLSLATGD